MSTVYNGAGTIPFATSGTTRRVAIVSSTNASPIVVQATAHGFLTGDTVLIEGHATNTAANGLSVITKTDANHFSLNGSVGNGVGGATGYCIDYEVQPAFTIPAPGELASMVTMAPVLEGLANPIPWLYQRTGAYRLYNLYQVNTATAPSAGFIAWSNTSITSSNTYTELQNATHSSPLFTFSAPAPVCQTGDILVGEFHSTFAIVDAGTHTNGAVRARFSQGGNPSGSFQAAQGCNSTTLGVIQFPVSLKTYSLIGSTLAGGDIFNLYLEGFVFSRTDCSIQMFGDYDAFIYHYKPN